MVWRGPVVRLWKCWSRGAIRSSAERARGESISAGQAASVGLVCLGFVEKRVLAAHRLASARRSLAEAWTAPTGWESGDACPAAASRAVDMAWARGPRVSISSWRVSALWKSFRGGWMRRPLRGRGGR